MSCWVFSLVQAAPNSAQGRIGGLVGFGHLHSFIEKDMFWVSWACMCELLGEALQRMHSRVPDWSALASDVF